MRLPIGSPSQDGWAIPEWKRIRISETSTGAMFYNMREDLFSSAAPRLQIGFAVAALLIPKN